MNLNVGQIKTRTLQIIREYSNRGELISSDDNKDYLLSLNSFADIAQREVSKVRKIRAEYSIVQKKIPNLLNTSYDTLQHLDDDISYSASDVKSYYFEVCGGATITITDGTSTIATITNTETEGFTVYKANIASDYDTVYINFTGDYPYTYRRVALYGYRFPTDDDVPSYSPYNEYTIPSNFYQFEELEYQGNDRAIVGDFKYFGEKTIAIPRDAEGQFIVHYYKYPDEILSDPDDLTKYDSVDLEIDRSGQDAMAFYMAHLCLNDEEPEMADIFLSQYYVKLNNLTTVENTGIEKIEDVDGWF